jgi:hypothetical protein
VSGSLSRTILSIALFAILSSPGAIAQRGRGAAPRAAGPPVQAAPRGGVNQSVNQSVHQNSTAQNATARGASQELARNPELASRLQPKLPAGLNAQNAADGFKNLGQFVAAVHLSDNLSIPFEQLKAKVTGPGAVSLGKAIQDLRPDLDRHAIDDELKKAKQQAARTQRDSAANPSG